MTQVVLVYIYISSSLSCVVVIQGYGSVRMSGLVWTDNTGSGTLSISQTGSAGASLGANGPGASFNVDISGTNFSRNQGFLNGGLFLDDCGSVLIRESSFINNSATSDGVRSSIYRTMIYYIFPLWRSNVSLHGNLIAWPLWVAALCFSGSRWSVTFRKIFNNREQ